MHQLRLCPGSEQIICFRKASRQQFDTMETRSEYTDVEQRVTRVKQLRAALSSFATGVTIVTTVGVDGKRHGLTANSFSSVSLEPPLVLWSQSLKAPSHPVFFNAEHFAINILAEEQADLSTRFSRAGDDKFAGLAVSNGIGDAPLLEGCAARFECRTLYRYEGGDHTIFVGMVERFERFERRPLIFGSGRYLSGLVLDLEDGSIDPSPPLPSDARAVRVATPAVADLARELQQTVSISVWGNHGATVVRWEQAGPPVAKGLRTGLVLPVLTSATGLLFAAYLGIEAVRPLMAAEIASVEVARIRYEALASLLEEIRSRGVSTLRSSAFTEMYGGDVDAISVPVFAANGEVVLAITAVKQIGSEWNGAVAESLLAMASRLSGQLGFRQPIELLARNQ